MGRPAPGQKTGKYSVLLMRDMAGTLVLAPLGREPFTHVHIPVQEFRRLTRDFAIGANNLIQSMEHLDDLHGFNGLATQIGEGYLPKYNNGCACRGGNVPNFLLG
jgi:hypothetical protein